MVKDFRLVDERCYSNYWGDIYAEEDVVKQLEQIKINLLKNSKSGNETQLNLQLIDGIIKSIEVNDDD